MSNSATHVKSSAVLSDCGRFRYQLHRSGLSKDANHAGTVLWVMLNPSTADADTDDNTIRRCKGFTAAWGYDALMVGNLYDYRTKDPAELRRARFPRSEECDQHLEHMAARAQLIVAAWGAHAQGYRARQVLNLLARWNTVLCLGRTATGIPKHPLYLAYSTPLEVLMGVTR